MAVMKSPYGIAGAVRPWESTDAKEKPQRIRTTDTPEQRQGCYACTKPECSNCLSGTGQSGGELRSAKHLWFLALYGAGKTDIEIGEAMGLSKGAVVSRRKKLELPPNPLRPDKDPCPGCVSAGVCRGGMCREKRWWEERA